MLSAWLNPPIEPLMKVYVFNITNPLVVQREVQLQLQLLDGRDESTFRSKAGAPETPNCYAAEKLAESS